MDYLKQDIYQTFHDQVPWNQYEIDGRGDFNAFMMEFDEKFRCNTWFTKMNLAEANWFDTRSRYTDDYPHEVLDQLIIDLFPNGDARRHMSQTTTRSVSSQFSKVWSLHNLQKEEEFFLPMSAMSVPGGRADDVIIHPGKTRRLFAGVREDIVDIMFTDYRRGTIPDSRFTWCKCEDYELKSYEGLLIRTYPVQLNPRYGFHRAGWYYKDIRSTSDHNYYIHNDEVEYELEKLGTTIYVNTTPLCERVNGKWRLLTQSYS